MTLAKADATAMFAAYNKHKSIEIAVKRELIDRLQFRGDWQYYRFDYYDSSVEFKLADNKMRLKPEDLDLLWSMGFLRTWICHEDGAETYYWKDGDPNGSRREAK